MFKTFVYLYCPDTPRMKHYETLTADVIFYVTPCIVLHSTYQPTNALSIQFTMNINPYWFRHRIAILKEFSNSEGDQ